MVLAASRDSRVLNDDARGWLLKAVDTGSVRAERAAETVGLVEEARSLAAGNVNPQLILSGLLADLHLALTDTPSLVTRETP